MRATDWFLVSSALAAFALAGCGDGGESGSSSGTTPDGFVRVEPGTFTMVSPAGEPGRYGDEAQHEVTLTRAFYLQATEVTQGQWT